MLVANGDSDRMVPSSNTHDLARRLPNSELIIYPDSGHGAVFQFHADFVPKALEFLARQQRPDNHGQANMKALVFKRYGERRSTSRSPIRLGQCPSRTKFSFRSTRLA